MRWAPETGQVRTMSRSQRRAMIDGDFPEVSVVRPVRVAVQQPLIGALPPGWGFRVRVGVNESYWQAVPSNALLGLKEDDSLAQRSGTRGQQKACAETDATNGHRGHLPSSQDHQTGFRTQGVSLPAQRPSVQRGEPGLGDRHRLYPDGAGIHVPDGHHGLAQPVRALVEVVQHPGSWLLRGCVGGGIEHGRARDIQHRPFVVSSPPRRSPLCCW